MLQRDFDHILETAEKLGRAQADMEAATVQNSDTLKAYKKAELQWDLLQALHAHDAALKEAESDVMWAKWGQEARAVEAATKQVAALREQREKVAAAMDKLRAQLAGAETAVEEARAGTAAAQQALKEKSGAMEAAAAEADRLTAPTNAAARAVKDAEARVKAAEDKHARAVKELAAHDRDAASKDKGAPLRAWQKRADATAAAASAAAARRDAAKTAVDAGPDGEGGTTWREAVQEADRAVEAAGRHADREAANVDGAQKALGVAKSAKGSNDPLWPLRTASAGKAKTQLQITEAVAAHGGFTARPIGPAFRHIVCSDMKWAGAVEAALAPLMDAFICTSGRDAAELEKLCRGKGWGAALNFLTQNGATPRIPESRLAPNKHGLLRLCDIIAVDNDAVWNHYVRCSVGWAVRKRQMADTHVVVAHSGPPPSIPALLLATPWLQLRVGKPDRVVLTDESRWLEDCTVVVGGVRRMKDGIDTAMFPDGTQAYISGA